MGVVGFTVTITDENLSDMTQVEKWNLVMFFSLIHIMFRHVHRLPPSLSASLLEVLVAGD